MHKDFQPVYIRETELSKFGLPSLAKDADIMNKIMAASSMIDMQCQKQDEDGYGSCVYSTYTERITLMQGNSLNIFRLSKRPLFGLDTGTVTALALSGEDMAGFDNGAIASPGLRLNGTAGELCAIISISGRVGNVRKGEFIESTLWPITTPQSISALFGGPPGWIPLDPLQCDYNPKNGEVWAPAGGYFTRFSEVEVTYTSGFDPRSLPRNLKFACANIVKNMMSKPIPGLKSVNFTDAGFVMQYSDTWIDAYTQSLLQPFTNVVYG